MHCFDTPRQEVSRPSMALSVIPSKRSSQWSGASSQAPAVAQSHFLPPSHRCCVQRACEAGGYGSGAERWCLRSRSCSSRHPSRNLTPSLVDHNTSRCVPCGVYAATPSSYIRHPHSPTWKGSREGVREPVCAACVAIHAACCPLPPIHTVPVCCIVFQHVSRW